MFRSYRFRLHPTRSQDIVLRRWLDLTREYYNLALIERRNSWTQEKKSITYFEQSNRLVLIRKEKPELAEVSSNVLRGALRQVSKAFDAFFDRCKNGKKVGYPRLKNESRFRTLSIDDIGKRENGQSRNIIVAGGKRVFIPKIGKVKFKQHRPLEGQIKAVRYTFDVCGRWFVIFLCEGVSPKLLPKTGQEVGIDLGLIKFATTNEGEVFENGRPFMQAKLALARAQRRLFKRKKGSKRRKKKAQLCARQHARIANIRREKHIEIARALVKKYDCIYVENLDVFEMLQNSRSTMERSIRDAGWSLFLLWLRVKAEEAGREVIAVNPRGTSQNCSGCGIEVQKRLWIRTHECPSCGLILDRDVNAACNILKLGRSLRGAALPVEGTAEIRGGRVRRQRGTHRLSKERH